MNIDQAKYVYYLVLDIPEYRFAYIMKSFANLELAKIYTSNWLEKGYFKEQNQLVEMIETRTYLKKILKRTDFLQIKCMTCSSNGSFTTYILKREKSNFSFEKLQYEIFHTICNIPDEYYIRTADIEDSHHILLSCYFISAS